MKRLMIVGASDIDGPIMKKQLEKRFFGLEVADVRSADEAFDILYESQEDFALILLMRVCNQDGTTAIDFIEMAKDEEIEVPIMILTEDEQVMGEATEKGAIRGFGKVVLMEGDEEAFSRIEPFFAEREIEDD